MRILKIRMTLADYAKQHDYILELAVSEAVEAGHRIGKYADPTEGAIEDLSPERAGEVAEIDASLVWVDTTRLREWAAGAVEAHLGAIETGGDASDYGDGADDRVIGNRTDWSGRSGTEPTDEEWDALVAEGRR